MLIKRQIMATPRVNLTRFHGVFAPNSKHRALITPANEERLPMRKIRDVLRLHAEALSKRRIAVSLDLGRLLTASPLRGSPFKLALMEHLQTNVIA